MSSQAITISRYVYGTLRSTVRVVLRAMKWSGLGSVWHLTFSDWFSCFACLRRALLHFAVVGYSSNFVLKMGLDF